MNPSLLETFCLCDGKVQRLSHHLQRMRQAADELCFEPPSLCSLQRLFAEVPAQGMYKLSVTYLGQTIVSARAVAYQKVPFTDYFFVPLTQNIYPYKWADRSCFLPWTTRCQAGEMPIFLLNGALTDTHFSNILLETPDGRLHTPATPLLRGTRREALLQVGEVQPMVLRLADLGHYKWMHLVNAMLAPGDLSLRL